MEFIDSYFLFLFSVVMISMSGVLMPGPLFAVTISKAAKRKTAGIFIALGHGIIEFPLMFLIYFGLTQLVVPESIQLVVGLFGGLFMMFMGFQSLRRKQDTETKNIGRQDSLIAGIVTTAANPGFILWWITIGTTLVLNAASFGIIGFSLFTVTHWLCDFLWYSIIAVVIFKSHRFWSPRVHQLIRGFCFVVLVGFGAWFFSSAIWILFNLAV